MPLNLANPSEILATDDPGDQTQRNFRYQHGYGAILLIAGAAGKEPYRAIWCEHHEDILAEINDDTYDAFQIKTRQPESGYWSLSHEEITKLLKRFIRHFRLFGQSIRRYCIVSNTEFLDPPLTIADQNKLKRSLVKLLEAVRNSESLSEIAAPFDDVSKELCKELGCLESDLYKVMKKVELIKGPPRENFETEISHNHLTQFGDCGTMPRARLNKIRDEIIQKIFLASSLYSDDPAQHMEDTVSPSAVILRNKRLAVEVVEECVQQSEDLIFRYLPLDSTIQLQIEQRSTSVLNQKLIKGNLEDVYQTVRRRTLSSEAALLERAYATPQEMGEVITQLESVVQAECDEAAVEALAQTGSKDSFQFGLIMYKEVAKRLREIAENKSNLVYGMPSEILMGVAGLLTENCSVWWSSKFEIVGAA